MDKIEEIAGKLSEGTIRTLSEGRLIGPLDLLDLGLADPRTLDRDGNLSLFGEEIKAYLERSGRNG